MLRRDLICIQSCQSLHCSRTYTKWVCLWHVLSVNVQTSLSMRAVSPEPLLLSHMRKIRYILSVNAQMSIIVCAVLPEPSLLSHMNKMGLHMTYFSVNAQTRLSIHAVLLELSLRSHIHKMGVFMASFISNAQTILSMRVVSLELSLLAHMLEMGVHTVYSSSQFSDAHEHVCSLARALTAHTHAQNWRTYGIFQQSILRRA